MLRTVANFDRIGEENAFAVLARANALIAQGRDVINLGIGQPDFRTPEFIVEAAIKALRDGHHGYTPATGIPPLREAVAADLHKRYQVERLARRGDDPAGRQADHVHVDPDVRRAGRRHPLSRSGISDLPLDDRIHRRAAGAGADPRGERLCVLGRGDAEADHAADAAPDRQLARQSDRRRDAEERSRQAGRRPRKISRRLRDVGRDLRPHGLRRREACLPAVLSVDPRPADPAQRLVEDLCDDRLAARLRGLAGQALRLCAQARRQLCTPASTPRRNMPGSRRSPGRRTKCDKMVAEFDKRRRSWSKA